MVNGYDEARVLFDRYIDDSFKAKTRAKGATSAVAASTSYEIHDEMSLSTVSIRSFYHHLG